MPNLDPYWRVLREWLPKAEISMLSKTLGRFDGVVSVKNLQGGAPYLVEEKRHFRHLDVGVVVDQLNRGREGLPAEYRTMRVLLLAPYIRRHQAAFLEGADIDYLDLAGNAHLNARGLLIHVEGRKPPKDLTPTRGRPQRGWVKTVMAILVRPELINAPYRAIAENADVALGTVAGTMKDLAERGLVLEGNNGRRIPDRAALVAFWVQAYVEALRPRLKERRFQIRAENKQEIWARLQTVLANRPWALTGADAAERMTHFFRAEETEIYAPVPEFENREMQKAIVAQPAVRAGNLLVIEPPGPLAITDGTDHDPPMTPVLLVYAELRYRGTGQALEAAELLLPRVLQDGAH